MFVGRLLRGAARDIWTAPIKQKRMSTWYSRLPPEEMHHLPLREVAMDTGAANAVGAEAAGAGRAVAGCGCGREARCCGGPADWGDRDVRSYS